MKKIDIDMVIIIVLCMVFFFFLFGDDKCFIGDKFQLYKSDNITIYRNNKPITLSKVDYLIGVVGCEVNASYEMDALKAQAIVARTYAYRSEKINRKLTDDTTTQCYKDNYQLKDKWKDNYEYYYTRVKEAVVSTDGLVIYYDNEPIDALYYAVSNGYSEDAKNVWGNNINYLVSVDSSWDKVDKDYKSVVNKELTDFLNILGVSSSDYSILKRDRSNRVVEIKVGNKVFSGVDFRKKLGLKSTDFEIDINNNDVRITTYGYGHGVGMSQSGANYMAKNGYSYEDIIKHYYTGVEIH